MSHYRAETVRILQLLILAIIVGIFFMISDGRWKTSNLLQSGTGRIDQNINSFQSLDGCYHVYLDVGSNVGVQVRKLFEPSLYPKAPFVTVFDKEFGPVEARKKSVCAVGFEPNPHHTKRLAGIESSYRECGWRAWFLKETGASNRTGTATFYSDGADAQNEWGGGILSPRVNNIALETKKALKPISLVRLSQFLVHMVGKRKLPPPSPEDKVQQIPPKVLMKMDIEGSEIDVLPDMLLSGGLSVIHGLFIEFHPRLEKNPKRQGAHKQLEHILNKISDFCNSMKEDNCNFKMLNVDDETYGTSNEPLPQC